MSVIKSSINTRSEDFQANAASLRAQVEDLRARAAAVSLGGGESARAKHTARGKLLPRDRVGHLLDPGTAFLEVGRKVMKNDISQMFAKGIVSGWMIATMVWMIPSMESAKMWIIILITYLMALGDFTHIVVGSAEVSYLVFAGELPWSDFWMVFAGPTLAGNIIGGSFIFALISHAQVRSDSGKPPSRLLDDQAPPSPHPKDTER